MDRAHLPRDQRHPPEKWAVGLAAAHLVEDDMVLGLGTGSTVAALLDALDQRREGGELRSLRGVPTSEATAERCRTLGISLLAPADVASVDLCLDGADELTPRLVLTKGGGGALLREKVVAAMADRFVVIASEDKLVDRLGDTFALPVEVVPFAQEPVRRVLSAWGETEVRTDDEGRPVLTDNGNAILDLHVPGGIGDPERMDAALGVVPGVAEHGLFVDLATAALLAQPDGAVRTIKSA